MGLVTTIISVLGIWFLILKRLFARLVLLHLLLLNHLSVNGRKPLRRTTYLNMFLRFVMLFYFLSCVDMNSIPRLCCSETNFVLLSFSFIPDIFTFLLLEKPSHRQHHYNIQSLEVSSPLWRVVICMCFCVSGGVRLGIGEDRRSSTLIVF